MENRKRGERVALVAESYLRSLEVRVQEMEKKPVEAFVLAGSMSSDLPAVELAAAITQLRKAQDAAALGRLAELAE